MEFARNTHKPVVDLQLTAPQSASTNADCSPKTTSSLKDIHVNNIKVGEKPLILYTIHFVRFFLNGINDD